MQPLYAQGPQDIPDRQTLMQMSGLEAMQAVLMGLWPAPPIGRTLNFTLTEVAQGKATFIGTPLFDYANPMGGIHGGWYGAILDSAMGCAVMTTVPKGHWYTTLEYKVNITRALPIGMEVRCIGEVQHVGRSTAVAQAEIRGLADNKLYATGTTTCIILSA